MSRLPEPEETPVERLPIHKKSKTFTVEVKSACANVSSKCGISAEKSRIAVKTVCNEMYGHRYYLSSEEQQQHEGTSEDFEPQKKVPKKAEDYEERYQFVLPSTRTILKYKHLQATQEETDAAVALFSMKPPERVTLHYDTTSRCYIDGEWPCLILNFTQSRCFRLRPLFFAYEDRENITSLIVETYERLAAAATMKLSVNVTAKDLWGKTNNIMTDSVAKNLKIEDGVALTLKSSHKPFHLLCKSHVVEKFDSSNLKVLASLENKVKLRQRLEAINLSLKPFIRGKKAVFVAGIYAILKLGTHEKSGATSSLAEGFDRIIEREGKVKYITLYHERRFTKLGYSAASILQALPLLQNLLAETWKSNLLVEACKIYLECQFFLTELKLLAYFTHKITLPFLNCIEKCSREELLQILPTLYDNLLNGKYDVLKDYAVAFKHVNVDDLEGSLENEAFKMMCTDAAAGVMIQCGREYGSDASVDEMNPVQLFCSSSLMTN